MFHSFFFENCTFTYDLPDRQQFEERMSQLFIIQHFHQIEPTFSFYPYFFYTYAKYIGQNIPFPINIQRKDYLTIKVDKNANIGQTMS